MQILRLNARRILWFFFLCVVNVNCQERTSQEDVKETYAIVTMLIDGVAQPLAPPPPEGLSVLEFKSKSDSIKKIVEGNEWKNKRFVLAIDTLMSPINEDIDGLIDFKHKDIVENLKSLTEPFSISLSALPSVRNIKYQHPKRDANGNRSWNGIDMQMSFSRISYNANYSKAVLVIGVSRGKLNGFSALLLLEKTSEGWRVNEDLVLSIS